VNDVAFLVNHDVAIVSVLDLKQKSDDRVCGHRLDEIFASSLELLGRLVAVLVLEVRVQTLVGLAPNLVTGLSVWNALDDSTL
jgi:hypothetical protein